jgi:DNA-binding response OmpR family regulator
VNFLVVQVQEITATSIEAVAGQSGADWPPQDVKLCAIDKLETCRTLRSDNGVTIIAIDRRGKEQDPALGAETDGTESGCLNVAIRELLTEITAMTNGTTTTTPPTPPDVVLQHSMLRIDLSTREVRVGSKLVKLTRKEFDLLHHLASRPKQVIRREQLMADIWGDATAHVVASRATRTIDTHINSLRSKLGCRTWVETVRGVGFRFVGAPE